MMLAPVAVIAPTADRAALRDCPPAALRLGVARSGSDLIVSVTNQGRRACTIGGLPTITFSDRHGRSLPIAWRNPYRMGEISLGHGPVVVPAAIGPGEQATSTLSFGVAATAAQRCEHRATITVSWGFHLRAIMPTPLCYAADGSTNFGEPWFRSAS